jgi:polygalacturonase
LTLNKVDAGDYQCFDVLAGSVTIVNGQSVNVKWFGAKGDGNVLSHDVLAFNPAVACVLNFTNGGELYVPTGTYVIETTIAVTTHTKGFTLRGDGRR